MTRQVKLEVTVCPSCGSDEVTTEADVEVNTNAVRGWCEGGDFTCQSCSSTFRDPDVEVRLVPGVERAAPWRIDATPAGLAEARRSNRRVSVREGRRLVGDLLVSDAERAEALTARALAPSDLVLDYLGSLVMADRESLEALEGGAPDGGEDVRARGRAVLEEADAFLAAARRAR